MSKRAYFTTVTPLPKAISRESVMETLHNHFDMIDLNPLVIDRIKCNPPDNATPEQHKCLWYKITDKITYLPGGLAEGNVSYNASFHDLPRGLQTHVFAPMGIEIKGKWTLGGTLPGEPKETEELGLGIPKEGLYLREDVDLRCNMLMMAFVKKDLKKSHEELVQKLIAKAIQREHASGRVARPNPALPPSYEAQQSSDQKPSRPSSSQQSNIPASYYEPTKRPPPHPLQGSGLSYNGQPSNSQQSSFSSARTHQSPPPAPQQHQQSYQPQSNQQSANYPYPLGPHGHPHQRQKSNSPPNNLQQQQALPYPSHQQTQPYYPQPQQQPPPSQPYQQHQPQRSHAAELPSQSSSLVPEPLRPGRTGSPARPAEMQG